MADPVTAIVPVRPAEAEISAELSRLLGHARDFAATARSPRTRLAYSSDWKQFATWCVDHGVPALPADPAVVAAFIVWLAEQGRKPSTVDRKLVALSQMHKMSGHTSPTSSPQVREVLKGLRRRLGVAPKQKQPVLVEQLKEMVLALPDSLSGKRDRALLLVGFAGGFRRSELTGIQAHELEFVKEGVVVTLVRSKTDQLGEGRQVPIPIGKSRKLCPVLALRAWLDAARIDRGPVFRAVGRYGRIAKQPLSGRSVARIIKRAARAAGYDSSNFAGHSLRAGFATAAAAAGKSERAIMKTTGHKTERMVRKYIRGGSLFIDNAADGLL